MEQNDELGIVYAITNKYMPGLLKIGCTHRVDLNMRMRELYNTSVPVQFDCACALRMKLDYVDYLENLLHDTFEDRRINPKREFFEMAPEKVISLMRGFCAFGFAEDVTSEFNADLQKENDADHAFEAEMKRKPNLDFHKMGLQNGDRIYFINDPSITCTIASERKVIIGNENPMSLTSVTQGLLKMNRPIRPTGYWQTESGVNLQELYDKLHK